MAENGHKQGQSILAVLRKGRRFQLTSGEPTLTLYVVDKPIYFDFFTVQ